MLLAYKVKGHRPTRELDHLDPQFLAVYAIHNREINEGICISVASTGIFFQNYRSNCEE
jgi:hypothetical protein